jgi:HlyD family secretion protein
MLLLAASLLSGCGDNGHQAAGSGFLEAREVTVSAETAGRVVDLRFDEGSVVSRGDTLLVIDPTRIHLELASAQAGRKVAQEELAAARLDLQTAEAAEAYARSEKDRIARLLESSTATQSQYDQVAFEHTKALLASKAAAVKVRVLTTQLDKIDVDIDLLLRQLDDCYPTAPCSGTVTEKYVEEGELLAAGKPMGRVSALDELWVKVYLPAGDFANIKINDSATVNTEAGQKTYWGTVVWTSPEAEFTPKNVQTEKSRANLVYAVKVLVPNTDGELKIGMPVFVAIDHQ